MLNLWLGFGIGTIFGFLVLSLVDMAKRSALYDLDPDEEDEDETVD